MPSRGGRDLAKTYLGKMRAERDETDHALFVWRFNGRTVLKTELSTPYRDVGAQLVSYIARHQLLLPEGAKALTDLVQCSMSAEAWQAHLERVADANSRTTL